jgi:hypothetical protein
MKYIITLLIAVSIYLGAAICVYGEPIESFQMRDKYKFIADFDDDGVKFIKVEGEISVNFGRNLSAFIQNNADSAYIELTSIGGMMDQITQAGVKIRQLSMPVVIRSGETCISACAYLALYSEDITIEGQLAFHMPYFASFNSDKTLVEISNSTVTSTLFLTRDFYRNKWAIILLYFISENTSIDTYLVFLDEEYLNAYRVSEGMAFDSIGVATKGEWHLLTNKEINKRQVQQQLLLLQD